MPLALKDKMHLRAASGYTELGMFKDAEAELDQISPDFRQLPEVLSARLHVYSGMKHWELMQGVAERLMRNDPANAQWPISYAYATRRARSLEVAKQILIEAVRRHPQEMMIPFNLACYECQLGNMDSAEDYLKTVFTMEPKMRLVALEDPDLKPLWGSLKEGRI